MYRDHASALERSLVDVQHAAQQARLELEPLYGEQEAGVYIGPDAYGGSFFYDPWALYGRAITNRSALESASATPAARVSRRRRVVGAPRPSHGLGSALNLSSHVPGCRLTL